MEMQARRLLVVGISVQEVADLSRSRTAADAAAQAAWRPTDAGAPRGGGRPVRLVTACAADPPEAGMKKAAGRFLKRPAAGET
jgi:hypothetical protein